MPWVFPAMGGGAYVRMVWGWSGQKKTEALEIDFVVLDVSHLARVKS